jgi:hypothetical protein
MNAKNWHQVVKKLTPPSSNVDVAIPCTAKPFWNKSLPKRSYYLKSPSIILRIRFLGRYLQFRS